MKFICKDFWTCVFKKQIDNLRTNHQVAQAGSLVLSSDFTAAWAWLCPLWLPLADTIVATSTDVSEGVVDLSGHLRPPGQHVSLTESTVSRKTVSGPGPEGTPVHTSAAFCCPSVECVKVERSACVCPQYLAFTCGLVRGALLSLGVKSIVTAEVSVMPASKTCFHLQGQPHSFLLTCNEMQMCVFMSLSVWLSLRLSGQTSGYGQLHSGEFSLKLVTKKESPPEFEVFFSFR